MKHTPQKSLLRLMRQLIFVPCLHNRWLTTSVKDDLKNQITHAEQGHRGEIRLIIENHLPISLSYEMDCLARAWQLFGQYGVWDTASNTGILIYVNLCEKDLQIVADRGINAHACDEWHTLCERTLNDFKAGKMKEGLMTLIDEIGKLLNGYFPCDDTHGNELPNQVVYLR